MLHFRGLRGTARCATALELPSWSWDDTFFMRTSATHHPVELTQKKVLVGTHPPWFPSWGASVSTTKQDRATVSGTLATARARKHACIHARTDNIGKQAWTCMHRCSLQTEPLNHNVHAWTDENIGKQGH